MHLTREVEILISYLTNIRVGLFGATSSFSCLSSQIILEASAPFTWDVVEDNKKTIISLPKTRLNMPRANIDVYDGLIKYVVISADIAGTPQLIIYTSETCANFTAEIPGLPHRLLIHMDRSPLQRYFRNQNLLLDPAYDGKGKEAVSPTGLPAHIPTLHIARRLSQLIAQVPARVNMTRRDAEYIPMRERLQMCREAKSTLFLGVACRAEKRKPQSGFQVKYYYRGNRNKFFAGHLEEEIGRKISIPSRGLIPVNMSLLREIPIPAAVAEIANIHHRLDEGLLRDVDFHKAAALGLFNGILSYFRRLNCPG